MTDLLKQLDAAAELGKKATKRPWAADYPQSLTGPTCPSPEEPFCGPGWPHSCIVKDSECVAIVAGSAGGMVGDGALSINEPTDTAAYIVASAGIDHAAIAAELRAKDAEIERLRAVIRSLEWTDATDEEESCCAFCMACEGELHSAGCLMGEAMGAIAPDDTDTPPAPGATT